MDISLIIMIYQSSNFHTISKEKINLKKIQPWKQIYSGLKGKYIYSIAQHINMDKCNGIKFNVHCKYCSVAFSTDKRPLILHKTIIIYLFTKIHSMNLCVWLRNRITSIFFQCSIPLLTQQSYSLHCPKQLGLSKYGLVTWRC